MQPNTGPAYNGKRYPPKQILEIATNVPVDEFWGGRPSNRIFSNLGFKILKVKSYQDTWKTAAEIAREQGRLKLPVPRVQVLVDRLLAPRWVRLHEDF